MSLRARLSTRAEELGFARFGVARVEPLGREAEALRRWLDAHHHASMAWMERTREVRADPGHEGMLPGARSVIALATPYGGPAKRLGFGPGVVARYARGRDYHNVLRRRAKKLLKLLRAEGHRARRASTRCPCSSAPGPNAPASASSARTPA